MNFKFNKVINIAFFPLPTRNFYACSFVKRECVSTNIILILIPCELSNMIYGEIRLMPCRKVPEYGQGIYHSSKWLLGRRFDPDAQDLVSRCHHLNYYPTRCFNS